MNKEFELNQLDYIEYIIRKRELTEDSFFGITLMVLNKSVLMLAFTTLASLSIYQINPETSWELIGLAKTLSYILGATIAFSIGVDGYFMMRRRKMRKALDKEFEERAKDN